MQKKQIVLTENRYIALLNKQEKSEINNLTYHLNELEKEEQTKLKISGMKEIIKIRENINSVQFTRSVVSFSL